MELFCIAKRCAYTQKEISIDYFSVPPKDYNVGIMFKASELLMCIVSLYNMIENRGMLKNVWETPMIVHDIVLYAPV